MPSELDYRGIITGFKGAIAAPQNDQHTLVENYIELYAIHIKMKRSLISKVGKGLSYLFGTATESDLKTICSNIIRLAKSQEDIGHVIDEKVLEINIIRVERSENRQALNKNTGWCEVGQFVQLYLQYCTGYKKKSFASLFLCGAYTSSTKHALTRTPFTISYYPKNF